MFTFTTNTTDIKQPLKMIVYQLSKLRSKSMLTYFILMRLESYSYLTILKRKMSIKLKCIIFTTIFLAKKV